MRIIFTLLIFVGIFCVAYSTPACACTEWKKWPTDNIMLGMGTKLVRGVANAATGWAEIPRSIYVTSRDEGLAQGLFVGPFQGILSGAYRTVVGVVEAATFFVPAPDCYGPYLDRPLVWSDIGQEEGFLLYQGTPKTDIEQSQGQ